MVLRVLLDVHRVLLTGLGVDAQLRTNVSKELSGPPSIASPHGSLANAWEVSILRKLRHMSKSMAPEGGVQDMGV